MARVERSPEARLDLRAITSHIAQDNPSAALKWLDEMEGLFITLAAHPRIEERLQTRRFGDVRRFSRGNYLVYFRPLATGVQILRVVHGARDQDQLV